MRTMGLMVAAWLVCGSMACFAGDPRAAAVGQTADGEYLYLAVDRCEVRLYVGMPAADSLDVSLNQGTTLVGPKEGLLQTGRAKAAAMLVTPNNELLLAWTCDDRTFLTTCPLAAKNAEDCIARRTSYATSRDLGSGQPTAAAWNERAQSPILVGAASEDGGSVWVARRTESRQWIREKIAAGQGHVRPQVAVSRLGVVHVVWRDANQAVWHLENANSGRWLRSGATSSQPEQIGTAAADPAVACRAHQVLVVLPTDKQQLEYSLYTGQNWNANLPLTRLDKRWANDKLSQPRLVVDGHGVAWLFFVNTTANRKYAYYTRWLGFGWDAIREGRGIFQPTQDFSANLAPIQSCQVPAHVPGGAQELGLLLVNWDLSKPLRPFRIQAPAFVARPGADLLFLDMLDVSRTLWVEQKMGSPQKHPDNPILRPSGDPNALDSNRVFNGGTVLRDGDVFRAWYTALNPKGDWKEWQKLMHLCYATSKDGIRWEKPNLGQVEFKGKRDNNAIPSFGVCMPILLNPDQSDPSRKFLGLFPGLLCSSADGWHWRQEPIRCTLLGPNPSWFAYQSAFYDPEAGPSRRWKAYGCFAPTDRPFHRRTIGYAYSADGKNFIGPAENPIVQAETSGVWLPGPEFIEVHDAVVCKYKGHYLMFYQTGHGHSAHIELAVSRDGEHFVRVHDGQPLIPQGAGDAWDRGMHLPSQPLVTDKEIRLYYGAANYQAPSDHPVDYERWKQCIMGLGLATLPLDGWAYLCNRAGRHDGYVTTGPIQVQELKDCVLTVNAKADKDNYLMAELLSADTDDRIAGYEWENCDRIVHSGPEQVVSWKGRAGLGGVKLPRVRVRVILRGHGDLRLYSIGFRRRVGATPPVAFQAQAGLVEKELVYASSVSNLFPLKAWIGYRPDGKPKPIVVAMQGYGDPVMRNSARSVMWGSVRGNAQRGRFAISVDLRGRGESAGQRDDGGLEVMDIYDAIHAALRQYPSETDPANINIIGWSGGGGNVFSAVTRMPDCFSNAAAFFGITDYGYWADTSFKGVVQPNVGGETQEVPDRYMARKSLLGVCNNAYTDFHFFWDEKERICPPWMDSEYRRIAQKLGYANIHPHESKASDKVRWLHEGMDQVSAAEGDRLTSPPVTAKNNPNPTLKPAGHLVVLGFLMTKRFQVLFGQGNDAVAELDYKLLPREYAFAFSGKTSNARCRGWVRVTDRSADEVAGVVQDGKSRPWEKDATGRIVIRDVPSTSSVTVRFK